MIIYTHYAGQQVGVANRTLDQLKKSERPYIWLSNVGGPEQTVFVPLQANPADGGYVVWSWHFTNYGKTPAYKVRFTQVMEIGDNALAISPAFPESKAFPPLPPNKDDFTTVPSSTKITQSELARLLTVDNGIVVRGRFNYADAYGNPYETTFCIAHIRTGATRYCDEDNDIK